MSDKINYVESFNELQKIVSEIEQGEISVDELSEKVKRAAELIRICKSKLTSTEEDVNKILKELDGPNEYLLRRWSPFILLYTQTMSHVLLTELPINLNSISE